MKFNLKSGSLGILHQFTFTLVLAGAVIGPAWAAPDNQGKEFVLGFMENYDGGGTVSFYLTGSTSTVVTVQGGGYGPETFQVVPEEIIPVTLPISLRASGSGTIENKGLLLSAPDEFVVYGLNQKEFTTDAYLGLPTDVAGTEYIVPSFSNAKKTLPSELQIIAHQDGTEITFTPKKATVKGVDVKSIRARKSARFTLNRLESIQFKAKGGRLGDLTGSVIISSKPISVFGGHQCGIVPKKALACDHLVEQIPPVNTWGNSFLTTPLASRTGGDIFRVLAANDGTTVEIDGETVAQLKKGQFEQMDLASGTFHHITTSGPALVVQYSKGTSVDDVVSDPFMIIIPPTEQFGSNYLISTPPDDPVAFENYINIVVPTEKLAGLRLDEKPIAEPFTPIGNTGYSGAQVPVGTGAHKIRHLSSNVPFGVYSYGFADSDSYGYPGGNRLAKIAEPCTPTESGQGDGLDNDCDRKIDEELFNELDDDGDGQIDEDLAPVESPVVNAGGPYTVNEGSSIVLNGTANPDPNGDQLTFAWDLDNDGSFETAGAAPTFTAIDGPSVHTVTLRVTGLGGSSQASTTVTVNNVAPTVNAGADMTVVGSAFSQPGSFTDPGSDTWSATVDYGDGSGVESLSLSGQNFTLNHTYSPGTYTVTVTVTDDDGGTGSDTVQVTVNTQAPTVDAGADTSIDEGSEFSETGSFTDSDSATWSVAVDYGDGSGSQALFLRGNSFVLNHTYTDNGVYSVTVTVTDDDGGIGSDTLQVTVENVAPAFDAGSNVSATVGSSDSTLELNRPVSFTDPGSDTWSATVDYGDGSGVEDLTLTGQNFTLNHPFSPGTYTVTVTVTDDDGGTQTDTFQVDIDVLG